jgi:predicted tellurium resistance membrane protein TerC
MEFLLRFLSITTLDLTLVGDNAVIIGMAVGGVERTDRTTGCAAFVS